MTAPEPSIYQKLEIYMDTQQLWLHHSVIHRNHCIFYTFFFTLSFHPLFHIENAKTNCTTPPSSLKC
jgi:hypothetical protein